ncbi:endo-1,3(4)-beta-glucanase [Limtongia smithiae]|uniref:endo-1,3(4)-beta-glucanase n=1 Tax=Limtongia smithiae TaxID=1125753 RepID=UPI0034CDAE55
MHPVDLFRPVATTPPDAKFQRRPHPLLPKSVAVNNEDGKGTPIHTNKFYANLYLGNQDLGVFVVPYVIWWNRGIQDTWGLGISQTSKEQRVFGPDANKTPAQYFLHPGGIRSMSLSAFEFDQNMRLELADMTQFSVSATFFAGPAHGTGKALQVPIVLGAGFVTGVYYDLIPRFNSVVGFRSYRQVQGPRNGMQKYVLDLHDSTQWVLYATIPEGQNFQLKQDDWQTLTCVQRVRGVTVQIAKMPPGSEHAYDAHAGMFACRATIAGTAVDSTATVHINWATRQANNSNKLLLFALSHHSQTFTDLMKTRDLGFSLDSQTKGAMQAYSTNDFYITERLPTEIQFAPWTSIPALRSFIGKYSSEAIRDIQSSAMKELEQDMDVHSNLNSMYFAGKALDKFAFIAYVAFDVLKDTELTMKAMGKLTRAYQRFATNKQQYPLVYDTTYKGLVSSGSYVTGSALEDFGNTYYNDHHFHYGYFVHAAAIIGYIDNALGGTWLQDNKEFVNALVRDIGNPSEQDPYFPVSRAFDWFHGHSWAKGLFESGDGKDQESTSEDYHHAYAIKLWGRVVGDESMEARGNMMLAIMKRSFNSYFLLSNDNKIQEPRIIGNKVTGILFENKVDHTTYFSANIECVQGIHMIPVTPISSFIRSPSFTAEEWQMIFQNIIGGMDCGGWKGILYSNVALFDPRQSYRFFASPNFQDSWLDGGASRTWYLAYAAGKWEQDKVISNISVDVADDVWQALVERRPLSVALGSCVKYCGEIISKPGKYDIERTSRPTCIGRR